MHRETVSRHIQQLVKDGLLELVIEKQGLIRGLKKNHKKPYRLSISGIFYLILNSIGISSYIDTIRNIFKNYKENPLYAIFLYPVIKEETLEEIEWDVSFHTIVMEYLKNVCTDIVDTIKFLKDECKNISVDGYIIDQVFTWHNNPKDNLNQDLIDKIRFFLGTTLKWENTCSLKITPNTHENTIEIVDVLNPKRAIRITILERKRIAVLRQNGKIIYEFSITPNYGFLSIGKKSERKAIDETKSPFIERYREQLISFLTKLRTGLIQSTSLCTNPTFETMSEDERYQKALEYLDRELKFNP